MNNWILFKNELPKRDGNYLVTYEKDYAEDYGCDLVGIAPFDVNCEEFGLWHDKYDPITLGFVDSEWVKISVVAWMPLPEPYHNFGMTEDSIPVEFIKDRIAFNKAWNCNGYASSLQSAIDEWKEYGKEWREEYESKS